MKIPAKLFPLPRPLRYWLPTWLAIYSIIIILGLLDPESLLLNIIRVSSIFLCFVYAVITFPQDHWLTFALFATCLSDLVLAFNNTSIFGLISFIIAQIFHLVRIDGRYYRDGIILFAIFATLTIALAAIFQFAPLIYVVCAFYAVTLTLNVIASARWFSKTPKYLPARLAFLGFAFFAACDICVGISYLSRVHILDGSFYLVANFFVWLFYYPAQVLLSNSGKKNHLPQA